MHIMKNQQNGELILRDEEADITIDKRLYQKIADYLRFIHGIKPKVEKPGSKTVRRLLLDDDRQRQAAKKDEKYHSQLKTLISAMMRYPGFKYKKSELVECNLYEFMDTVKG
jgi:hypothetical protein